MASLILRRSISSRSLSISIERVRQISSSSSSSSAPVQPWLMIEDGGKRFNNAYNSRSDDEITQYYNFYSLAENQVLTLDQKRGKDGTVVGSSHGWLALYKSRRHLYKWRRLRSGIGFDMFLYNPLSHQHINLPPFETLRINHKKNEKPRSIHPKKVILSSYPDQPEDDTCRAIMSLGRKNRLAYCCPGVSKEWTLMSSCTHENGPINDEFGYYSKFDTTVPRVYDDFVYSKTRKQLFCTTKYDSFECWDLRDPRYPITTCEIGDDDVDYDVDNYPFFPRSNREKAMMKKGLCRSRKYLVFAERSNRLFLVTRNVMKETGGRYGFPIGFDVHEVIVGDEEKERGELRYMDGTLDGMAFFVGSIGDGLVIEEMDEMMKNNVEPNTIYFTGSNKLDQGTWGRFGVGSFNYENRTFSRCPCDLQTNPKLTWFTASSSYHH